MGYKTFGEMTPEEKGALLLAHHEGKTIEFYGEKWFKAKPDWLPYLVYRVKPEPKVETVVCQWSYEKGGKDGFTHPKNDNATHKITFDVMELQGYVLLEDEIREVILALVTEDTKRKADVIALLQDKLKASGRDVA